MYFGRNKSNSYHSFVLDHYGIDVLGYFEYIDNTMRNSRKEIVEYKPTQLVIECEAYVRSLRKHLVASMYNRQYSPKAKYPFKVMSFVNAMNWRLYETSRGALALMKRDLVIPSLCLVRAIWEDMAITFELSRLVNSCCENKASSDKVDETLMKILFANRYDKNNRFVGDAHYDAFKDYSAKNIVTLISKVEKVYPQTKDFYSTICEFVHPNGDGVGGSYSRLDEESDIISFGPQISKDTESFSPFITMLSCALMLYLRFIESIEDNIEDFAILCEAALKSTQ